MSGYRDRSDTEIFGEQAKPTRAQWVVAVAAIVAGLAMMLSAIGRASGWLGKLDFGIAPLGIVEFMLGWTYIIRARANAPGERYSPRALRWVALIFFILGALIIGIGISQHFKGA
jgi:hypothetical protein